MKRRILTRPAAFCGFPAGTLFSVNEGMPVADALEQASNLLACVDTLAVQVGTDGVRGSEIFAIQCLAEMAKALVDASRDGVYRTEGDQ